MAFCERPVKTCKVTHLRVEDLGTPSDTLLQLVRQPTVDEVKYNKVRSTIPRIHRLMRLINRHCYSRSVRQRNGQYYIRNWNFFMQK